MRKSVEDKSREADSHSLIRRSGNRNNNHRSKLDMSNTLSRIIDKVDTALEDWKCLGWIIIAFLFFFAVLPAPFMYLALQKHVEAYLWLIGWGVIFMFWSRKVEQRKSKALLGPKYKSYPKALEEYIELLNRD